MSDEPLDLVWPHARYLAGYVHALEQGWSPDNLRPQTALDELARIAGLGHIELTTDASNVASQRVIEANGGVAVERFFKPKEYGGAESIRFRIALVDSGA